jgi:HEPN domain-containing protein
MALRDRDAADVMRREGFFDLAAFHLHQAVEKLLKALLLNESVEPPRTHDLAKLHSLLIATLKMPSDAELASLLRKTSILHVAARYPVVDETTAPEDWVSETDVDSAASAWSSVSDMAAKVLGLSDLQAVRALIERLSSEDGDEPAP